MTTNKQARRLRAYAVGYAHDTWGIHLRPITADEVLTMEIRSDGYANAHVEGEHEANGLCSFSSARECGERQAAAEFVETMDSDVPDAHVARTGSRSVTVRTHDDCDHASTKSARAACRRAVRAARTEKEN